MRRGIRWMTGSLAVAALGASTGCAGMGGQKPVDQDRQRTSEAQQSSKESLARAQDAQQGAIDAEKRSTKADEKVDKARTSLHKAEESARQSRTDSQEFQRTAQQTAKDSQREAQLSQADAVRNQQQQSTEEGQQTRAYHQAQAKQGQEKDVTGRLVDVSGDSIIIKPENRPAMTMNVEAGTDVSFNERQVSVSELPEGGQVRASYELKNGTMQVTKLEALSP